MCWRCEPAVEFPCPSWERFVFPAAVCKTDQIVWSPPGILASRASSFSPANQKEKILKTFDIITCVVQVVVHKSVAKKKDFTYLHKVHLWQFFSVMTWSYLSIPHYNYTSLVEDCDSFFTTSPYKATGLILHQHPEGALLPVTHVLSM